MTITVESPTTTTAFADEWARWHNAREDNLRDPVG